MLMGGDIDLLYIRVSRRGQLPVLYSFTYINCSRDADDAVYEMNGRELLGER
jgi:hypothetical protein